MSSKYLLGVVSAASVVLVSSIGLGAMAVDEQGSQMLKQVVRDPLAVFGQRSPGPRPPGALFQTKPLKTAPPQALLPPNPAPPTQTSGLVPPVSQAAYEFSCAELTRPVSATASPPASPEAERLASHLVAAVQKALADNQTSDQAQREDAVERGIERVLDAHAATPEVARSALQVVHVRLVALGLSCAPGVPQAMEVASIAASDAAKPTDLQPASTSQPGGPVVIGLPPGSGGGGGGGGVTHPGAV